MKQATKQRALHRTKIIEGQIRGLQKMIANEAYCMDILTQSLAIQRSLGSLNKVVLENHLQTCAQEKLASGDAEEQQEAIAELLNLYDLNNIRGK